MDRALGRSWSREASASRAHYGLRLLRILLILAYCAVAAFYFLWRIGAMNAALPLWSAFVLAAELAGFFWSLTFLLPAVVLQERTAPAARDGRNVDVFVPTYNEPVEIVSRTVTAAMAIRYPHHTWLLDDGNRDEMRALAARLGCRYIARGGNEDAKAGNLNNALAYSNADFIALFDADHVADVAFLDRCLGYFEDEDVAFVQTPQEFYNHDSHQHLSPTRFYSNEHSLFYRVVQRSRDRWNAAMLCGCAAVLRRSALDSIGGFATGTVTEDMHTSVRLHARGWRSVFHPEVLSAGVAPLDAQSFRTQRLRWAQGALQVAWQERILRCPGLSAWQRAFYLLHVLNHLEGWRHLIMFLLPAIVLLTGLSPIRADAWDYIAHFGPYFAFAALTYRELGRDHGRLFESEVFNMARCATSVTATFALFRKHLPFRVTPKVRSSSRPGSVAFPWLVLGVTLIAFATRAASVSGETAVAAIWGLFSAGAATRLLLLSHRCAKNRRRQTRLPCRFVATLHGVEATIFEATADGFTLRPSGGTSFEPGLYAGCVTAGDQICNFTIDLKKRRDGVFGGAVYWNDDHSRRSFDVALHQHAIRRIAARDRGERGGFLARLTAIGSVIAIVLALLPVTHANAFAGGIVLAGSDASSTSSYTYMGAVLPARSPSSDGNIVLRVWSDRLTYSFLRDTSRVSASSWGQSLSAGYQHVDGPNYITLLAGLDNRTSHMMPDLGLRGEGTHLSARFEGDVTQELAANVQFNGIASYVTSTADYWTRAQILFGRNIAVGPEYVSQGNTNYREQRAGLAVTGIPLGSARFGIDSGYQRLSGASSTYLSLSLSTSLP